VVVETVIVARVLGAPLLRLDGTVVLAPGVLYGAGATPPVGSMTGVGDLASVAARLADTSARQRRCGATGR
jgi:hypothetical protein